MGTRMFSFILRFVFSDKSFLSFFSSSPSFSFTLFAFSQLCLLLYFFVPAYSIFQRYKNGVRTESMDQMDGKKELWRGLI